MPAATSLIRIGLLLPSTNVTLETELPALLGRHPTARFTLHSSRLRLPAGAEEESLPELPLLTRNQVSRLVFSGRRSSLHSQAEEAQRAMHRQRQRCVAELMDTSCQVLLDGCLEALLPQAPGAHFRVLAAIGEQLRAHKAVAPVVLTRVEAVLEALQALGAQRIALLLPDPMSRAEQTVAYLTAEQVEVTAWATLDEADDAAVARIPLERILVAARRLDLTRAQALLLSPEGQMPSLPLIEVAEREFGVPVVSAVTAAAFTLLRRLDLPTVVPDAGRLLKHERQEARSASTVLLRGC